MGDLMRGQGVIIFLMISLAMMMMLYISLIVLSGTMERICRSVTVESRLNDLANSIANDLTGAIIFLPHNTSMNYSKVIPAKVAGESYYVEYDAENERVTLESRTSEISIFISGLRYEINGSLNKTGVGVIWINVSR